MHKGQHVLGKTKIILGFIAAVAVAAFLRYQKLSNNSYQRETISYYQAYSLGKPDTLFFCQEAFPKNNPSAKKRLDHEMYKLTRFRKSTRYLLSKSNYWLPIFEDILRTQGVPEDFKFIPIVESGLTNAESHKAAFGFWQFIDVTAREHGLIVNDEIDERLDPIKSTYAAARFFKRAYKRLGSWTNVAAAYNMGINGFSRASRVQHLSSYYDLDLNRETGEYVFRILAAKEVYGHMNKYGYHHVGKTFDTDISYKTVKVDKSITDLKAYVMARDADWEGFKSLNPWIKGETLTVSEKRKYFYLRLPIPDPEKSDDTAI